MANTLKLRGIDACLPEIQTFLREIEQSFLQVLNSCVPADQQEKEAIQLRDTIEGIGICLQNSSSPDLALDYLSNGSFKETYRASDSIIVKFCASDNETQKEEYLLKAAKRKGLGQLFVPTSFHCLPFELPTFYLEDPEIAGPDYVLDFLEIQPLVTPAYKIDWKPIPWDNNQPIHGIPVKVLHKTDIYNLTWIEAVLNCYGKKFFMKFADFCEKYQVWDLGEHNIGFMKGTNIPVIFDWLSD